jgi:RND family efflux transporter MFP subunit
MCARSWLIYRAVPFVVLPCLFFLGCKKKENTSAAVSTAPVAQVMRTNLSNTLTVMGAFQPYQEVELHAKVSGYVRRINVDIGDQVKEGQVIATLEVPELNAQVAGSEAEVRHRKSEIQRAKSDVALAEAQHAALHSAYVRLSSASHTRPGLVAEQELDDSKARDLDLEAKVNAAKAAMEAAQEQLGVSNADHQRVTTLQRYSVVTAPFSGVITARYADVGSLIQAGTTSNTQAMPLVKIAQSSTLRLRMPVPEEDVPSIHIGGSVQIKLQATGKVLTGTIVRFSRELAEATRTMQAEVDLPNADLALSAGMTAEASIVLQEHSNTLAVPATALIQENGTYSVLAVDRNGIVRKVVVRVGIQSADQAEILQGVTEGESVIVSGQSRYQTGQHVRMISSAIHLGGKGNAE